MFFYAKKRSVIAKSHLLHAFNWVLLTCAFAVSGATSANQPGRGATAEFETSFMQFLADHHTGGLPLTELCMQRAQSDELISLCRVDNAVQREQIAALQRFLLEWYGTDYTPTASADSQQVVTRLSGLNNNEFDQNLLQELGRHHYTAAQRSLDCQVGIDIDHPDLARLCESVVFMQTTDTDEMRHILCNDHNICDFQPFNGNNNGANGVNGINGASGTDGTTGTTGAVGTTGATSIPGIGTDTSTTRIVGAASG